MRRPCLLLLRGVEPVEHFESRVGPSCPESHHLLLNEKRACCGLTGTTVWRWPVLVVREPWARHNRMQLRPEEVSSMATRQAGGEGGWPGEGEGICDRLRERLSVVAYAAACKVGAVAAKQKLAVRCWTKRRTSGNVEQSRATQSCEK